MDKKEILEMYKSGISIDFITNKFFDEENSKYKNYYAHDGNYIVNKNRIKKSEAKRYVNYVILSDIKNNNVNT